MARYSLGSRTTGTASGAAAWEFRTGASYRGKIMEIGISLATAVASTLGLGRPAAIGVTPTTPVTLLALDPNDGPSVNQTALAWATGPTVPTAFIKRITIPGTIGFGVIWQWANGLIVPASSSLVIWNLALNGLFDVYVDTDE